MRRNLISMGMALATTGLVGACAGHGKGPEPVSMDEVNACLDHLPDKEACKAMHVNALVRPDPDDAQKELEKPHPAGMSTNLAEWVCLERIGGENNASIADLCLIPETEEDKKNLNERLPAALDMPIADAIAVTQPEPDPAR
jgi:hypothetical protein